MAEGVSACAGAGLEPPVPLPRSAGLQAEAKKCQERLLQSQIDDVRLLVKGLDGELRASESRQTALNRRLAEVCGRLNGFQEEQSQLDGRVVAVEVGQKTLASSTQQALRVATTLQMQQDEAECAACLDGLSRGDPLPAAQSPSRRRSKSHISISGLEDFPSETASASTHTTTTTTVTMREPYPAQCSEFEMGCRKQLCQQELQLEELRLRLADLMARPQWRPDAESNCGALFATMQSRLEHRVEQQGVLLEQLDARLWVVAEGQTRLETLTIKTASDDVERVEKVKFALAAAEISKLQACTEEQGAELKRVKATLQACSDEQEEGLKKVHATLQACTEEHQEQQQDLKKVHEQLAVIQLRPPAACVAPETKAEESALATADVAAPSLSSCMAAAWLQGETGLSKPLALEEPSSFSAAVQLLDARLEAACSGVAKRCDELQRVVDQDLKKACDWLPAVDARVEQLAAQCQDCILRTEAQDVQIRGLRAEHDASCRRLLVLADQVSSMSEPM